MDLSNNFITNICNEAFEVNQELRSIDLSNNHLKVLYPKTFENCKNSVIVNLKNNHLDHRAYNIDIFNQNIITF